MSAAQVLDEKMGTESFYSFSFKVTFDKKNKIWK